MSFVILQCPLLFFIIKNKIIKNICITVLQNLLIFIIIEQYKKRGETMDIISSFGSYVFNETAMLKYLPDDVYKSLKRTIDMRRPLDESIAAIVAGAMKDWALSLGATHFTHWFQPLNGITAEKHDAFIMPDINGKVILEFSGKELIKGEPDASSFPNGGLRSTFEARGYTIWDASSYAFVKDDTLCIPTAFCSYSGQALDQKTPLLASIELINKKATALLNLLGNNVKSVIPAVGAEQEYFLIDESLFKKRKDLVLTGRTLVGAMPPKGQELNDHYFGSINDRVSAYMKELDKELWKLGIYAKTKHNEVAPAQHELAPVFTTLNLSADHNQLTMEIMARVAKKHKLVCLLHEKPFAGVNGSGKHNNWSLVTDNGENLFNPKCENKLQFLLFVSAVIKAVHKYSSLLRNSVASASNDHRLGGNEAPPAIISIFLGAELTNILDLVQTGELIFSDDNKKLTINAQSVPDVTLDANDRNRTSPMAFTGNKFEFRMVGSSNSISACNIVLNTAVADVLNEFYLKLEKCADKDAGIIDIIKDTILNHGAVIFNDNNYTDSWTQEALARGLPNHKNTYEALVHYLDDENIELFATNKIFTKEEMRARFDIHLENYINVINIEALCLVSMLENDIIPASIKYAGLICQSIENQERLNIKTQAQRQLALEISTLIENALQNTNVLKEKINKAFTDNLSRAEYITQDIIPEMEHIRYIVDKLETLIPSDLWPLPTYTDLLFNV